MAAVLTWYQPRVVKQWEWKHELLPEWRRVAWLCLKWMVILGFPTLLFVADWFPKDLRQIASGMVYFTFAIPVYLFIHVRISSMFRTRYEVRAKGLYRGSPGHPSFYEWTDVETYHFNDHPELTGIRRLDIKVRKFEFWQSWSFDPAETEEAALRAKLQEYLPTAVG